MIVCSRAWVKSARKRNRATACKKAADRAERGRKDRGLVKAADKGLAGRKALAKAVQVVRAGPAAVVKLAQGVRVARAAQVARVQVGRDQADKAAARVLPAEVVAVGKNKCCPAGCK